MTVAVARLSSLRLDEWDVLNSLTAKLADHRQSNDLYSGYYEGMERVRQLGIAIPPGMQHIGTVVGWAGTTVDVLEERLDWLGWAEPEENFGLEDIYLDNDLDVESSLATLDALIYGTAFIAIGSGAEGEPDPLVTIESPLNMTGHRDPRLRRLGSAMSRTVEDDGSVLSAVLYLPDETITLARASEHSLWKVEDRDRHNLGRVPVVQMVNRARAGRQGGRSEISRAVRSYTDAAVRTMLGMEVNREFYSAPQRWSLNIAQEKFQDTDGNLIPGWQTVMGRVWAVEPNEEGEAEPKVGQFDPTSPGPYLDQVRGLAQLLAAEAGIPAAYLGFATENPASADAIRAGESRLVKRAERRQTMFGKAWLETARLALLVRDGEVPDRFNDVGLTWRDAATPTRAAAADETTKYVAAGVLPADSSVTLARAGFSPQEQKIIGADRQRAQAREMMTNLRAQAGQPSQASPGSEGR